MTTQRKSQISFACPTCKRPLEAEDHSLSCRVCGRAFPVEGGLPDFLSESELMRSSPNYAGIRRLEFLAPVYEGRVWHDFILRTLAGARRSSLESIHKFFAGELAGVRGAVLDVACGPATHGRRLASPDREVCAVDFSAGTLRQGMRHILQEGIAGIRLARASVEALPFEDGVFDGAICGGALHLFPDTRLALREIARTLKPGAPLAVTTFVNGKAPLAGLMRRRSQMHVFEEGALQKILAEAGLKDYHSTLDGMFLQFAVRKTS